VTDRAADGDLAGLAATWRANFDANVLSAVLVTAALTPKLAIDGRVITVGSIAARNGAGSYGAAKAAVEAWTAHLATDLGPRGITANVVALASPPTRSSSAANSPTSAPGARSMPPATSVPASRTTSPRPSPSSPRLPPGT